MIVSKLKVIRLWVISQSIIIVHLCQRENDQSSQISILISHCLQATMVRAWKLVGSTHWNNRILNLLSDWERCLLLLSSLQVSVFQNPVCPSTYSLGCYLDSCSWFISVSLSSSVSSRYGHGFEMFCLASDSARTVVASACKVSVIRSRPETLSESGP